MTLSSARQLLVLLLHVIAHALQQIINLTIPIPAQYFLTKFIILKYLLYAVDTIYYGYSAIEITCYCTLVLFFCKKKKTGSCYIVLQLRLYNKFRLFYSAHFQTVPMLTDISIQNGVSRLYNSLKFNSMHTQEYAGLYLL